MSLPTLTDHWGAVALSGTPATLALKSDGAEKSARKATAQKPDGMYAATEIFGETTKPANDLEVCKDITDLASFLKLGMVSSSKMLLAEISIETGAAAVPTIKLSGDSAPSDASSSDYPYAALPAIALSALHKAQILASAFTCETSGVELNKCSLKASVKPTFCEPAGMRLSYDFSEGIVEVNATFVQYGATAPVVTASEGWDIDKPLSKTGDAGDYSTWTITLSKPLTKTLPA